jgi:hypothetical protein
MNAKKRGHRAPSGGQNLLDKDINSITPKVAQKHWFVTPKT